MKNQTLLNFLFPAFCPLCGKELEFPSQPFDYVCDSCRLRLPYAAGRSCRICGIPLLSEIGICGRCRKIKTSFDSGYFLYFYRDEARELLYQYKMANTRYLSRFFAAELRNRYFTDRFPPPLIPVPVLKKNFRKRGWDPVGFIVRDLHRFYGYRVMNVLQRLPSVSQKTLNQEQRKINIRGKIRLKKRRTPPAEAILIDDVWTTGSTLEECAKILKQAGAEKVSVVTLVRD